MMSPESRGWLSHLQALPGFSGLVFVVVLLCFRGVELGQSRVPASALPSVPITLLHVSVFMAGGSSIGFSGVTVLGACFRVMAPFGLVVASTGHLAWVKCLV